MNPLDRNHDGRVNLQDLKNNDRNHDGIPDNQQGLAHRNPLDRNGDGRVDLNDLTGRQSNILAPGMTQTTTSTTTTLNQGLGVNPLDRNGDGILDSQQGLGLGQTAYVQSGQRASLGLVRSEPTVIETIQKDVVIQERIHPVMKEEIQPVIYREREQLDVKQVTQMMHETQIQPTIIQQRELPAQTREAVIERAAPIAENYIAPTREVDATLRTQVVHAPIVNEVIKKTIIEEIQPVLERDIIQSTVIQNTQPIYEKFVEAPTVYREVRTVVDRGVVGGDLAALEAQGFNLGTTGRRLSQGYTGNVLAGQGYGLDRNHDGIPDNLQQGGLNQGLNAHHNPLDRNHDGRVDLKDLNTRDRNHDGIPDNLERNQGLGSNQGLAGAHHNPLDRNHDGKVNLQDLSGKNTAASANRPVNLL